MKAEFRFTGVDKLHKTIKGLPATLIKEARPILMARARALRDEIRAAYPKGETGNLRKGVNVRRGRRSRTRLAVHVNSDAPHAWWIEHGTQVRHSRLGNRGAMTPQNIFVPRIVRARQAWEREDLRRLLEGQDGLLTVYQR